MHKNKILKITFFAIILLNIIAFFHAYKFTHFDINSKTRTNDPNKLSSVQKIKTLFFGVDNPRPINTIKPQRKFKIIKIKYKNDTIECWYVPIDSLKQTILLFHGYAGNKSQMIAKSDGLNKLGYNTVLVDFLGSGGSTGNKTTIGYYESEQVKFAYDYFKSKNIKHIIMLGTSMGSVAIIKSIYDYKLNPESIIIECPFGNMLTTVQARFKIMNAPVFPMSYLLVFWGGLQNNFNAFSLNPTKYAGKIDVPTLVIYGIKDNKVSRTEIDEIYKNLKGKKELLLYENAGHEDLLESSNGKWGIDVSNFIESKKYISNN